MINTTRTLVSCDEIASASLSAAINSGFSALRFSGRFSVMLRPAVHAIGEEIHIKEGPSLAIVTPAIL